MKVVRRLYLLSLVTLLLSFALVFTPAAKAQMIHALLVGDNDADSVYAQNVEEINNRLLKEITEKQVYSLDVKRFDSTAPSETPIPKRVDMWLEDQLPGGLDVVFIYYSRSDRTSDDEGYDLDKLAKAMESMQCRLKILIADTDFYQVKNTESADNIDIPDVPVSILENLFVEPKGFLYLTSKSDNEFAFGDANGGWFTQALVGAIQAGTNADEDGLVSWEEILKQTQAGTKKLYEKNSPNFSDELRQAMQASGVKESQTPMSLKDDFPTIPTAIHALLVIVKDASTSDKSVADINYARIRGLLREAADYGICDVKIQVLPDSDTALTPDKIKAWAEAVSPRENDTVFIYYSANDSMADDEAAVQGELLNTLKAAITGDNAKKSRLQMLIVDTYRIGPAVIFPRFSLPYPQTVFHNLFFEHKGFLHLASKESQNKFAFGDVYDGGWFTRALITSIYEIREREDFPTQVPTPSFDFVKWDDLIVDIQSRTRELFKESYSNGGFEAEGNYLEDFSKEQRGKLLEELKNLSEDERKEIQIPKAHNLPERM